MQLNHNIFHLLKNIFPLQNTPASLSKYFYTKTRGVKMSMRHSLIRILLFSFVVCIGSLQGKQNFFDWTMSLPLHKNHILKITNEIPLELRDLPYATYPQNIEYNTLRFNYNKRFNVFPKAIIAPRTYEEAKYVLSVLTDYQLEFSVRSGGHCFEPGSLSSDYIFDLRNFKSIIPNISKEEVYIGAGCRLHDVIETLGEIDYAIPTGTCPSVGATGLTLGGGIGLLVRTFGLTCDSLKKVILLNADSKIIEADEHSHPDLFWALKGGGNGSYGIVLGLVFKMHYIPTATFFDLTWDWKPKCAEEIIHSWQEWVKHLPPSISSSLRLEYKEGNIQIRIIGIKVGSGSFNEWKEAFKSFNPKVEIHKGRYIDNVKYWAAEPFLPFNKIKSKILLKPLSRNVIRTIIDYLDFLYNEKFNLRIFLNFDAFGGNVPNFDNAFAFKNAFGWWYQAVYWPLQTQDLQAQMLINRIYHETSSEVSPYSYANATDYELGAGYLNAYYGKYVDRLIRVKSKYDPRNIFHWHQSIPTSREHNSCGCDY